MPSALNKASHHLVNGLLWLSFRRSVNRARRQVLDQGPRHRLWTGHPMLYGVSPALLPPPADWPANARLCGQWLEPADGYTLLHSTSALGFTAAFGQKVAYRLDQDLAPVSLLIDQPLLVMASKPLGVTNVQQLKDYAARHPGKLNYGSSGTGNLTHLAMFVLLQAAGIEATHIPYKGGAGAFPDFIAGRLDLFADPINSAYPYVRDGRVVALAVTGAQRSPLLPDVPTASEVILPGFQMGAWQALMAPAGTPPAVIARINDAYVQALNDPKVAAQLASQGAVPKATSPGDFQVFLQAEIERWRKVVQTSGIKLD
ncbi:Bug family tripartite tricarboxylate transporter substrate binding protein [Bordetella bronchiseptica]|uniref:Bug family tripartite tricarboxylate transporter substrate binding protein n=1 Tax=Bordetella bronchiseptica TaxID=518 RepID=UPI001F22E6B0|nr:tripartite tricarboxylate transporter substrate-binding protein [Bordetella bronchiseptica]